MNREPVNLFKKPLTEEEQWRLSEALDDFLISYESQFSNELVGDAIEDSSESLIDEFRPLYEIVKKLQEKY